jgi:TRAP transporter TAXI family solute receptor
VLRETGGTAENLALLESGAADLATAQADVPAGRSARLVANLFSDAFQLLVRKESAIRTFSDLEGKRISVPSHGGQFQSFLNVAEHFGFSRADFVFPEDDESGAKFISGETDALFRVRAMGNPLITRLARGGKVRLVPIDQAAAMRIRTPSFEPSVIPQGAYLGNPPVPEADLATVAVQRTLVAHVRTPDEPVNWLTGVLMEDREEIARAIPDAFAEVRPLLASIRKPDDHSGLSAGIHPGAVQYYEKDKPSFVVSNADFCALIVTLVLLGGSWLWELKRWLGRKQKNRADAYNHQIILLYNRADVSGSADELEQVRHELMKILTRSVCDLDEDRISHEDFQSLRVIWQIAIDAVREKHTTLQAMAAGRVH